MRRCRVCAVLLAGLLSACGGNSLGNETPDGSMSADCGDDIDVLGTCVRKLGVFAQPHFRSATQDTVTASQIYHASGIVIDRSVRPNFVYIADAGNQRVLGFRGIGVCADDSSRRCNGDGDCGEEGACTVSGMQDADIVFGQPSFQDGTCNGDANLGTNGPTSAASLCLIPSPRVDNMAEAWSKVNMDVDAQGNLYVPDVSNNRVLRYNQPFSQDRSDGKGDTVADFVWGQPDFTSNGINHGLGPDVRDAESLFFGRTTDVGVTGTNHTVSVDPTGAVWVADKYNNRVLRFPSDGGRADLVIGQNDFTSSVCNLDTYELCSPTLAKVHPETGELFVFEEHGITGGFAMRVHVYAPPFENGEAPIRTFTPPTPPDADVPRMTGLTFNTYRVGDYADGEWWLTEHDGRRVLLIDREGDVIKVINARDLESKAFEYADYDACGQNVFAGFNLYRPSGSVGIDADGNLYVGDEHAHRFARFALPYSLRDVGGQDCPPLPNGGLFGGFYEANAICAAKIASSRGLAIYDEQLIVRDRGRFLVWNDYREHRPGDDADVIVNQSAPDVRDPDEAQLGGGGLHAIDDGARLWSSNAHGALIVYALPLVNGAEPLANFIELRWADDDSLIEYHADGVAFDPESRRLFVVDSNRHRVMRIADIDAPLDALRVDMVLGQPDKDTVQCNHDQPPDWMASGPPTAESMCSPYQIRFDNEGNLFVVENFYECHGNNRITVFTRDDLAAAGGLFPNLAARKVFIRDSLTEQVDCSQTAENEPTSPIAVAFNSRNEMVIANDGKHRGHYGDTNVRHLRQLWLYRNPLATDSPGNYVQGQTPDAYIRLPIGAVGEMWFDAHDNLIIQDHTWSRVLMINLDEDPAWIAPLR